MPLSNDARTLTFSKYRVILGVPVLDNTTKGPYIGPKGPNNSVMVHEKSYTFEQNIFIMYYERSLREDQTSVSLNSTWFKTFFFGLAAILQVT